MWAITLFRVVLMFSVCAADLLDGLNEITDYSLFALALNSIQCSNLSSAPDDVSEIKMYICGSDLNSSVYLNKSVAAIRNYTNGNLNNTYYDIFVPGFNSNLTNQVYVCTSFEGKNGSIAIIIDHSKYTYSDKPLDMESYKKAVAYAYYIAIEICSKLIVQLWDLGVPLENIKLMGHSLGAHIIGAIGECFFNRTGTKLLFLYGADPAGPCFKLSTLTPSLTQLQSGQAGFVLIIHCNAGVYGTDKNLGDMNCYANDGMRQPGCNYPLFPFSTLAYQAERCSHIKCTAILIATARNRGIWNATACNSYDNYINGRCSANRTAIVGVYTNPDPVYYGTYYFTTSSLYV